jgi:hypothetical protein
MAMDQMAEARYPTRIPREAEIPPGLLLIHNRVRPARRQGTRGFRYWLAPADDRCVLCECGWAPEAGAHYRIGEGA